MDEKKIMNEEPKLYEKYTNKVFDKNRFTEDHKKDKPEFFSTRKGTRRFTVKTGCIQMVNDLKEKEKIPA